jgi:NADPH-dependent glutamate synthase beta subunit-like oxidoreductase
LTAAYYLAKKGHDVTVYEELPNAGGMPRYGIPEYRLPREVTEREIRTVCEAGLKIETNTKITDLDQLKKEGFDAVLLAIGAHGGIKLPLEGANLPGVLMNIDFLRSARLDKPLTVGEKVVVLGGGNVAFDCARLALRSGAQEVHIACLEARGAMTSSEEEIQEGLDEGIQLHPACTFVKINGSNKVTGIILEKVQSFTFDENRRAVIETVPDSQYEIVADHIIFAIGQRPVDSEAFGLEMVKRSYFSVTNGAETNRAGVFACGDAVTGTKSVVEAIAGGRTAAECIDKYLGGDGDIAERLLDHDEPSQEIGVCEGFSEKARCAPALLDVCERIRSQALVEGTLDETAARAEANRCLQCDLRQRMTQVEFRKGT